LLDFNEEKFNEETKCELLNFASSKQIEDKTKGSLMMIEEIK